MKIYRIKYYSNGEWKLLNKTFPSLIKARNFIYNNYRNDTDVYAVYCVENEEKTGCGYIYKNSNGVIVY